MPEDIPLPQWGDIALDSGGGEPPAVAAGVVAPVVDANTAAPAGMEAVPPAAAPPIAQPQPTTRPLDWAAQRMAEEAAAKTGAPAVAPAVDPLAAPATTTEPPVAAEGDQPAPVALKAEDIPESVATALRLAATQLGVHETDITKLPEAITQARESIEAERTRQAEAAAIQRRDAGKAQVQQRVLDTIARDMHREVGLRLQVQFPQFEQSFWDGNWDSDAEHGAELMRNYDLIQGQLMRDKDWSDRYNRDLTAATTKFEEEEKTFDTLRDRYPHAPMQFIEAMRTHGAELPFLEEIARVNAQSIAQATATLNSANASKDARIKSLEDQVSALSQQIERAKSDGQLRALDGLRSNQTAVQVSAGGNGAAGAPGSAPPIDYTKMDFFDLPIAGARN